jgi:hypothetical protein
MSVTFSVSFKFSEGCFKRITKACANPSAAGLIIGTRFKEGINRSLNNFVADFDRCAGPIPRWAFDPAQRFASVLRMVHNRCPLIAWESISTIDTVVTGFVHQARRGFNRCRPSVVGWVGGALIVIGP